MKKLLISCLLAALLSAAGAADALELKGAGATFPLPYYAKMFEQYQRKSGVTVAYEGIGSGGGIRELSLRTVDFGGSDAMMSNEAIAQAGAHILHIPTCLGAVVMTYNLPGNPTLKMTPAVISAIYLGSIEKWNDPQITSINPGITLPDMNIVPVRRSDSSGTTAIFSDYLSKASPTWQEKIGRGKTLDWTIGLGARGNPGVAGLVKQVPGSIGYVELIYAMTNAMPYADIKNKSGAYITPSIESVSLAAEVALPDDTRISITDTDAGKGYPICGFTWLLVFQEQNFKNRAPEQAKALVDLLWWVLHEGQQLAAPLHYAPLPGEAVKKAEKLVRSMTFDGKSIMAAR